MTGYDTRMLEKIAENYHSICHSYHSFDESEEDEREGFVSDLGECETINLGPTQEITDNSIAAHIAAHIFLSHCDGKHPATYAEQAISGAIRTIEIEQQVLEMVREGCLAVAR